MITYGDYREFIAAIKATHGVTTEDIERNPVGQSYGSRHGVRLGNNEFTHKTTGVILGYWEVIGADKIPGRGLVTFGRGNVEMTAAQKEKLANERCYGLLVIPDHGPRYISVQTQHSCGPWDRLNADAAMQDKYEHLTYCDEFDHGTIRVIKVKKVDGNWVAA